MAMTLEQLKARVHHLGGSDVPALLGVGWPDRNIGSLYLEKTQQTEIKVTSSPEADLGDRLEPMIVEWVGDRLGLPVERGHHVRSADGILRAQLDGYIQATGEVVEAKSAGLLNPMFRAGDEGWGPEGTDQLPFRVLAQVQFQLMLAEAPRAHVGAFLGGGVALRHYVVEAMPDLQDEIKRRCYAFWNDHVLKRVPPEEVPTIETLKTVKRIPGRVVDISPELVERLKAARDMEKLAAAAAESVAAEVMHAVGDAEEGISIAGHVTLKADKNGKRSLRLVKGPK